MTMFFSVQSEYPQRLAIFERERGAVDRSRKKWAKSSLRRACERHMKQVSYVTSRITRNREDGEDAAQECFLNAFVHLKALMEDPNLHPG